MKLQTLEKAEEKPVSHDMGLKKKLLVPGGVGCISHISQIVLKPGSTASTHSHKDSSEVFYCVRGSIVFNVDGRPVTLSAGSCLIVEPGEEHAIVDVGVESEMVYMMVIA
jgi:mannose-6-phosphate isomerase-like protein (cupin superfamily)